MPAVVSTSILAVSGRIESERVRLENLAVDAVSRTGRVALRHATAAVRLGYDPVWAARDVLLGNPSIRQAGLEETVARSLVTAFLLGFRRTGLSARQHFGEDVLTLSRADDRVGGWLRKLTDTAAIAETEIAGLWQRARAAAATIVRRMTAPLLRRVAAAAQVVAPSKRAEVQEIGTQFAKAGFVPGAEHGIAGEMGAALVRSYESGRSRGWRTPQIQEKLWGLRYSAILDNRTTTICRGLDGTVLPLGDAFWDQWAPPNHYGCRSCVVEVWSSSRLRHPPAEVRSFERFGADFFIG